MANESMKPTPTRKIDHGSVFRITSVTGTWFAVETPRFPVNVFHRYCGYADQIGSSDPSDAWSCFRMSGLLRIASP